MKIGHRPRTLFLDSRRAERMVEGGGYRFTVPKMPMVALGLKTAVVPLTRYTVTEKNHRVRVNGTLVELTQGCYVNPVCVAAQLDAALTNVSVVFSSRTRRFEFRSSSGPLSLDLREPFSCSELLGFPEPKVYGGTTAFLQSPNMVMSYHCNILQLLIDEIPHCVPFETIPTRSYYHRYIYHVPERVQYPGGAMRRPQITQELTVRFADENYQPYDIPDNLPFFLVLEAVEETLSLVEDEKFG